MLKYIPYIALKKIATMAMTWVQKRTEIKRLTSAGPARKVELILRMG